MGYETVAATFAQLKAVVPIVVKRCLIAEHLRELRNCFILAEILLTFGQNVIDVAVLPHSSE